VVIVVIQVLLRSPGLEVTMKIAIVLLSCVLSGIQLAVVDSTLSGHQLIQDLCSSMDLSSLSKDIYPGSFINCIILYKQFYNYQTEGYVSNVMF